MLRSWCLQSSDASFCIVYHRVCTISVFLYVHVFSVHCRVVYARPLKFWMTVCSLLKSVRSLPFLSASPFRGNVYNSKKAYSYHCNTDECDRILKARIAPKTTVAPHDVGVFCVSLVAKLRILRLITFAYGLLFDGVAYVFF